MSYSNDGEPTRSIIGISYDNEFRPISDKRTTPTMSTREYKVYSSKEKLRISHDNILRDIERKLTTRLSSSGAPL